MGSMGVYLALWLWAALDNAATWLLLLLLALLLWSLLWNKDWEVDWVEAWALWGYRKQVKHETKMPLCCANRRLYYPIVVAYVCSMGSTFWICRGEFRKLLKFLLSISLRKYLILSHAPLPTFLFILVFFPFLSPHTHTHTWQLFVASYHSPQKKQTNNSCILRVAILIFALSQYSFLTCMATNSPPHTHNTLFIFFIV